MNKLEKIYTDDYYSGNEVKNVVVGYVLKMIKSEFKNKDIYLMALTEMLDRLFVDGKEEIIP